MDATSKVSGGVEVWPNIQATVSSGRLALTAGRPMLRFPYALGYWLRVKMTSMVVETDTGLPFSRVGS